MRQVTRIVSWGLMLVAALSTLAIRAEAEAIISYNKVIDVGQRSNGTLTEQPSIDESGHVTEIRPSIAGDYTLGTVFDPYQYGVSVSQFLHRTGSDANLLTPALQDSGAFVIVGLNASGHLVGSGRDGQPFYFSSETGQILQLKPLSGSIHGGSVFAINNLDQIVGESDGKATFYSSPTAEPVELSKLLTTTSGWNLLQATGINDRGEIVGFGAKDLKTSDFMLEPSPVPEPTALVAFALAGGALAVRSRARRHKRLTRIVSWGLMLVAALSTLAIRAEAEAIISYNKVIDVGQRSNGTLTEQPSIDESGHVTEIRPSIAGDYTLGTVFDPYQYGVSVSQFLHRTGSDANLLTPALQDSGAFVIVGLNASGHLVGSGRDGPPFYFSPETGQILQIKPLPGSIHGGSVFAINNLDQIVGESDGKATFYSSPTAEPVELSKMLSTASGWDLLQATGINDRGEIVGYGISPASKESDFMLEPSQVPEPTALVTFALAGGVLATRSLAKRYGSPS